MNYWGNCWWRDPGLCGLCCRSRITLLAEGLAVDPPALKRQPCLALSVCGRLRGILQWKDWQAIPSEFRFWGGAGFGEDSQTTISLSIHKRKRITLNALKRMKIGWYDSNWFVALDKIPESLYGKVTFKLKSKNSRSRDNDRQSL